MNTPVNSTDISTIAAEVASALDMLADVIDRQMCQIARIVETPQSDADKNRLEEFRTQFESVANSLLKAGNAPTPDDLASVARSAVATAIHNTVSAQHQLQVIGMAALSQKMALDLRH